MMPDHFPYRGKPVKELEGAEDGVRVKVETEVGVLELAYRKLQRSDQFRPITLSDHLQ